MIINKTPLVLGILVSN